MISTVRGPVWTATKRFISGSLVCLSVVSDTFPAKRVDPLSVLMKLFLKYLLCRNQTKSRLRIFAILLSFKDGARLCLELFISIFKSLNFDIHTTKTHSVV